MARNPVHGIPDPGVASPSEGMRVADYAEGERRVYWAPTQERGNREAEAFIDEFAIAAEPYLPPDGWPVAGESLKLPMAALWVIPTQRKKSGFSEITDRAQAWWDLGVEVKGILEARYPNLAVVVVHDDELAGVAFAERFTAGLRFLRWLAPLEDDAASGEFLGADVLGIVIEQDFGFSLYHANDQDFDAGEVATRSANYAADYDQLSACREFFRGHATWLYHEEGAFEVANEVGYLSPSVGGPGGFTDQSNFNLLNSWWRTSFKDAIMAGTGNYANRGLTDLGWEYRGAVDYATATATEFVAAIETHFGLGD
jgi:hypothetical protein